MGRQSSKVVNRFSNKLQGKYKTHFAYKKAKSRTNLHHEARYEKYK